MSKVLLFHGGGPTAVFNAGLAGAINVFQEGGHEVYAARCGIANVLKDGIISIPTLDKPALDRLSRSPGSAIGSGRDHLEAEDYEKIAEKLSSLGFSMVTGSGGNGTMDTVRKLAEACRPYGITVTGIPKTMDNDLSLTDHSPGYLSAALYMASSVREAMYDVKGLPIHVVIIESFGRNAGWITAASALAGNEALSGPDMILLPEVAFDEEKFLARVEEIYSRKGWAVVVASEGLHYADGKPIVDPVFQVGRSVYFGDVSAKLSQLVTKKLGIKSRSEKPGILSRSSMAHQSTLDRNEALICGRAAAEAAMAEVTSAMSVIRRPKESIYRSEIGIEPISDEILAERRMPAEMIDSDGFSVTEDFISYIRPLLGESELGQFTSFI